jgi:hypothetical protein
MSFDLFGQKQIIQRREITRAKEAERREIEEGGGELRPEAKRGRIKPKCAIFANGF